MIRRTARPESFGKPAHADTPSVTIAALIVWAIICVALWAKHGSSITDQSLLGPDDYMRTIQEVISVAEMEAGTPYYILGPVLAIVVAVVRARRSSDQSRVVWLALCAYLAAGLALSFWQARFVAFAHVFAIVPIAWLASSFWRWVADRWQDWRRLTLNNGFPARFGGRTQLTSFALINAEEVNARDVTPRYRVPGIRGIRYERVKYRTVNFELRNTPGRKHRTRACCI